MEKQEIKLLQNHHTTPEQSKRLLELGVPMDSADCICFNPYYDGNIPELAEIYVWKGKYPQRVDKYTLPCWSAGRLIEIFEICTGLVWQNEVIDGYTKIDMLLEDFDDRENKYHFDFSKLEDYLCEKQ